MRRTPEEHTAQPWRVHEFAPSFELLDVWRFPIRPRANVSLTMFLDFLSETQAELLRGRGMAAKLFRLRAWLGRVFGWDREPGATNEPAADSNPAAASVAGFRPVYSTDDEALFEIENATVHALMHVGRVRLDDADSPGDWAPQMAVYVKPRGVLGRAYMSLISPFRHWIVYPAMMRAVERAWPASPANR